MKNLKGYVLATLENGEYRYLRAEEYPYNELRFKSLVGARKEKNLFELNEEIGEDIGGRKGIENIMILKETVEVVK